MLKFKQSTVCAWHSATRWLKRIFFFFFNLFISDEQLRGISFDTKPVLTSCRANAGWLTWKMWLRIKTFILALPWSSKPIDNTHFHVIFAVKAYPSSVNLVSSSQMNNLYVYKHMAWRVCEEPIFMHVFNWSRFNDWALVINIYRRQLRWTCRWAEHHRRLRAKPRLDDIRHTAQLLYLNIINNGHHWNRWCRRGDSCPPTQFTSQSACESSTYAWLYTVKRSSPHMTFARPNSIYYQQAHVKYSWQRYFR